MVDWEVWFWLGNIRGRVCVVCEDCVVVILEITKFDFLEGVVLGGIL